MTESVDEYVHTTRIQGKVPLWARILHIKLPPQQTIITFDNSAAANANRPPSIFHHEEPEHPLPEGKFTFDRKGRPNRVRNTP